MSTRLALTPVIGLFTGAMVSFGAVSMFLTGVHSSTVTTTNPCTAGKTSAAHLVTAHTAALLDAAARPISAGPAAQHAAATPGSQASLTSSSPSPQPSLGPPATPTPSPGGGMVTPSPATTPKPQSTTDVTPKHSNPTLSPGGGNTTPTASPTPSASPTPTATSTPPTATLCLNVQPFGGSTVEPGSTVQFAVVVWLTSGTTGTADLSLTASPSSAKPTFSVCQVDGKPTCTVTGLKGGLHIETQAELTASKTYGTAMTLTVKATSKQAVKSASATAKFQVEAKPSSSSPTPTPTPTPTTNTNAGNGGTYPTSGLPGSNGNYPGVTNPAGNLGSAFPTVAPSPNADPGAPARHGHAIRATDLSAGLPLTVRLIGGQVIGLAILAAAVTIAVARLSIRRQQPRHTDDDAGSTPAS